MRMVARSIAKTSTKLTGEKESRLMKFFEKIKYWKPRSHVPSLQWHGYPHDKYWGPFMVAWAKCHILLGLCFDNIRRNNKAYIKTRIHLWRLTFIFLLPRPVGRLVEGELRTYSAAFHEGDVHIHWAKKGVKNIGEPGEYIIDVSDHCKIMSYPWNLFRDHTIIRYNTISLTDLVKAVENNCKVHLAIGSDLHDGRPIPFAFHIQRREWNRGDKKWFRWMKHVFKPLQSNEVEFWFYEEVGPRKGGWKGGVLGTGLRFECEDTDYGNPDLSHCKITPRLGKSEDSPLLDAVFGNYMDLVRGLLEYSGYLTQIHRVGEIRVNASEHGFLPLEQLDTMKKMLSNGRVKHPLFRAMIEEKIEQRISNMKKCDQTEKVVELADSDLKK